MLELLQKRNLSDCSCRNSLILMIKSYTFQGNHFICQFISCFVDNSIGSFTYFVDFAVLLKVGFGLHLTDSLLSNQYNIRIIIFEINLYSKQMSSKLGKLFQARDKLKQNDLQSFKKQLQKEEPEPKDCENFVQQCWNEHRQKFVKVLEIIKPYTKSIFQLRLQSSPLVLQLCRSGAIQQFNAVLRLESISNFERKEECVEFIIKMQQRKDEKQQNMLQMLKVLYEADPKAITNSSPKNIADAIDSQLWEVADFLIQKGVDVGYESKQRQNLLHILMKKYNKKEDKQIMNLKNLLVSKGVDQKKQNIASKKPYDLCPPEVSRKINEENKSQLPRRYNKGEQHSSRYKGKSQQGSEFGRGKGNDYREKSEASHIIKIDNPDDICKLADNYHEKRTKEKQREVSEKQRQRKAEKSRQKQRERREKINKKVFTPEELKQFLNEEINYFVEQIQKQNQYQKSILHDLIQKITKQISQKVGATVKIFGSFATGLSLLQSDIDMVIIPEPDHESQSSFSLLQKISLLFESMPEQVESIKYIKTASVPIIKIQCTKKYDSKKIDITYKDQNHNGLISVELILKYLQIYPKLRPLVFVLKKFIYSTNIYDPYSGGLSSYGLILMIVAYLQDDNRERKSKGIADSVRQPTIAQLLIGFLYFYGFKSNYINKQICIIDPEKSKAQMEATYLQKYTEQPIYIDAMDIQFMMYPNDWQPRAKLVIIDPLNPKNNIGRATHKIRQIKTAFEMAYVCIHTNKNCKSKKNCESYQRIMGIKLKDTKCENYKRPCCIIKRMLNSTKSLTTC